MIDDEAAGQIPNAQYNLARPGSLSVRVATRMRRAMFDAFMREIAPSPEETVLDVGVTSDRSYESSNYFEALYPWKNRVTAAGLDDARFLEEQYPGMRYVHADGCDLPFPDGAFDIVHSSAVLEHVGGEDKQARMLAECVRVARRAVCVTTPNRWFPIEFHTHLPLIHWLPKPWGRAIMRRTGYDFFAREANLNLVTKGELMRMARRHPGGHFRCTQMRLLGWTSNLVLFCHKL